VAETVQCGFYTSCSPSFSTFHAGAHSRLTGVIQSLVNVSLTEVFV